MENRQYLKSINEWHWIPGYEMFYMINSSNNGVIKSVDRLVNGRNGKKVKKGKILKQFKATNGYWFVRLCKNGEIKNFNVHRLLGIVFIPNPDSLPTINHNDGNKENNELWNLEWYSKSDQIKHAIRIGLYQPPMPTLGKFGNDHNRSKAVGQYDIHGKLIQLFGSTCEAARMTGFHQTGISKACRGELSLHKGFRWQFYNSTKNTSDE